MNVLLTGGAGYIGSHIVRALKSAGHKPVVFDNLTNGHPGAIDQTELIVGDVSDGLALREAMQAHEIELVIHLAAFIEAGESVLKPDKYFRNNTIIGLTLLEAMRECGVGKLVFSSTAAVYGIPAASGAPGEKDVVVAIVPVDRSTLDLVSIYDKCRKELESNFVPSYLQVLDELPKTISEKPQERFLIELFEKDKSSVYTEERVRQA